MKQIRNKVRTAAINHINKQDEETQKNFKQVHNHYKETRSELRPFKKIIIAGLVTGIIWLGFSSFNYMKANQLQQQILKESEQLVKQQMQEQAAIVKGSETMISRKEVRLSSTGERGCLIVDENGKEHFASRNQKALEEHNACENKRYIVKYHEKDGQKVFDSIEQE